MSLKAIKEVFTGFNSLVTGMRITLREFFKPNVTLQYPHQSLKMLPRFRGHIELVRDPVTGRAICFACKSCEKACPSDCIIVEGLKREGEKKKSVSEFMLDFTKCSLCGSCIEACKSGAIRFSKDYNLAGTSKEDFIMDLFKRLEAESQDDPVTAPAEPAKTPAPAAVAAPTPAPAPVAAAAPAVAAVPASPAAPVPQTQAVDTK
jgi:NADH-quinone oxidoreductase subunit I